MTSGIEIYGRLGELYMDGTGRYGRVIDILTPNLGTGSKTYSDIAEDSLDFAYFQGDFQALTVWKSGQTINWRLDDAFYAGGFSGSRLLVVVAF
ncbi:MULTISPECIES: hypothetical protein [unclassified Pseudomonas]|uniref:hypothetical protein n=1 Tax=unclassified Pseudomonas TaxID=196821 RepID=UPI001F1C5E53|nr:MULTISPECIES: hypothetical protein [unclassified Pseudomonas]MCF5233096.1 hypothetical protein [Pseudomonas sp. PA-5-4H]MCF5237409.1 hypothetical protein [Pseudomonas sp. PA-5-4G]MCF5245977.1 hypothetical protein [Pseudomonas sp. PA-5-4B]MCF5252695.1 hypothetical protein [Pseudomonas sp. PA-5-4B]MCF5257958.1 hypothetical protein [Pseudomonas sp. PA-5-4A]